ncbi:MAG TPA: type I-C CRISPR-associated protein Cas7/Csd2 [Kiritimatiellia bacterium]|nr:type I-C CRISPR-associated protein Cas7/Csd2 [Kiritimatiellia bacterium]HMO98729.1 type I-C CRISPR-associated protein Cas7/Csd2 [Kiritimatiellia bacterium]HMP96889.1 type I-C CRISPR-associated protein Cas7/Csd2 [Kiritimatiellia bacterium]
MNRYDFVYLFDVKDANPNGDPDAGNLPRVDPETGHGLVTDVCLKRKIRNYVMIAKENESDNFGIFIQEKTPLNPLIAAACRSNNLPDFAKKEGKWDTDKAKSRPKQDVALLQKWLCERYYDIRTFGAVMSTGPNAGQLRGPIQLSFARSVEPVISSEHAITRLTDVDKEEGEMGRKFTVPYGLYRAHGFVNPFLADKTGFGEDDLKLLWDALLNAFQFDQSAARPAGSMSVPCMPIVFKHSDKLGSASSHALFERVKVVRKDLTKPARSFSDYDVSVDESGLPDGVSIITIP